jgi:ferrous iron transport protein A
MTGPRFRGRFRPGPRGGGGRFGHAQAGGQAAPRPSELTLADLRPGQAAAIQGYAPGSLAYRGKLLALGLTPGTSLRLLKVAPLGDPLEVEVRGFHLSLRAQEARVLILRKEPSA